MGDTQEGGQCSPSRGGSAAAEAPGRSHLGPAKHEGLHEGVQLGDDIVALLLREQGLVGALLAYLAEVEPRLKVREAAEHIREDEVEERPELRQVVLQGRPCTREAGKGRRGSGAAEVTKRERDRDRQRQT